MYTRLSAPKVKEPNFLEVNGCDPYLQNPSPKPVFQLRKQFRARLPVLRNLCVPKHNVNILAFRRFEYWWEHENEKSAGREDGVRSALSLCGGDGVQDDHEVGKITTLWMLTCYYTLYNPRYVRQIAIDDVRGSESSECVFVARRGSCNNR